MNHHSAPQTIGNCLPSQRLVGRMPSLVAALIGAVFLLVSAQTALAQSGSLDTSFDPGDGANGEVYATAIDADGKIIIAGWFTEYDSTARIRIARLNADGSLDTNFDPDSGADSTILALAIDANDKIIIAGEFTKYDSAPRNRIARLNPDGSLDPTFDPGTGFDSAVVAVAIDANGKIIIAGWFTEYDGDPINHIARLNPDGTLDTTFDLGNGANDAVFALAIDGDGKIIIAGRFTEYDGNPVNRIARLNPDGTLDTTFDPGNGFDTFVYAIKIDGNERILAGGDFTEYDGTSRSRLARLNPDGALDTTFDPGSGANGGVYVFAIDAFGKILIVGEFTEYDGTTRNRIARLSPTGTLDTAFDPGDGVSDEIYAITIDAFGKIIIAGRFDQYDGTDRNYIARVHAGRGSVEFSAATSSVAENDGTAPLTLRRRGGSDGALSATLAIIGGTGIAGTDYEAITAGRLDTSFNPGSGANDLLRRIVVDANGKILIGGDFTLVGGTTRNRIARLNPNGTLDASFNLGSGANSWVQGIAIDADGKIIIAGHFTEYDGTTRNRIARLNANGTLDTSFFPGDGPNQNVVSTAIDADGKILIGGDFTLADGIPRNCIARLNANGSLDTSFNPGTGANGSVLFVALDADGKILIAGNFTQVNGTPRNRIARLNTDGTLDASFNPGTGANSIVRAIVVDADGKILITGEFTGYDGTTRNRIARLNPDGALDASFNPGTGANDNVFSLVLDADGKIVIGGTFTQIDGANRNRIARLNANGTLDTSFDPPTGANSPVLPAAIDADGKIVIGGTFTQIDGASRNRIARIHGNAAVTWNDGDMADKTFDLTIFDNAINQPDRTVEIEIESVTATGSIGAIDTHTLTILDDDPPAFVTTVASTTADGAYGSGANVAITVTFSQPVTVNLINGIATIALNSGGTAVYTSGSGTDTLTFTYTVAAGENAADLDTTGTTALALNNATIHDGLDDATLTLPTPGAAGSLGANANIVIDTANPTIASITSTTADGTYNPDDTVNITINFSEAVTLSGGNLEITLDTGAVVVIAPFGPATSASGTYTVATGDNSTALDSVSPVVLTAGTLVDAAGNALTDFAIPDGQSLADLHAIVIESLPELLLKRGDTVITLDGSDVIGNISADGGVFSVTYTAENTGSGTLTITAIEIDGLSNADSTLDLPSMPITIAPGDSETFTVRISPSKKGEFNATIRIDSNLPGQSSVTITVSGTGTVSAGCGIIPAPFGADATGFGSGFGSAGRGGSVGAVWPLLLAFAALLIVASLRRRRRWAA